MPKYLRLEPMALVPAGELTATNYTGWVIRVQAILEAQDLWEAVEPAAGAAADRKKCKTARAILLQALPEDLLMQVAKKTAKDMDAPFNRFIASRGLAPLHVSLVQRLPFADGVLDIVHSMHVLSNWVPDAVLEFALFDIYRPGAPAPGGVFWLDHFFCLGPQLNGTYVPILDRVGFRRLRWKAGRKLDRGADRNEWYVSALLEKPVT